MVRRVTGMMGEPPWSLGVCDPVGDVFAAAGLQPFSPRGIPGTAYLLPCRRTAGPDGLNGEMNTAFPQSLELPERLLEYSA